MYDLKPKHSTLVVAYLVHEGFIFNNVVEHTSARYSDYYGPYVNRASQHKSLDCISPNAY